MERSLHDDPNSRPAPLSRASAAAPLLVWSILSLVPLLLAAARIPLWAQVPAPAEQFALPMMFLAQLVIPALLFSWLMPHGRAAAMVMLGSGLLLQLSGILGDETWGRIGRFTLWIWMWQGSLWLVVLTLRTARAQQVGAAISTTAAIGGAILLYLCMEFGPGSEVGDPVVIWLCFGFALFGSAVHYFLNPRVRPHL